MKKKKESKPLQTKTENSTKTVASPPWKYYAALAVVAVLTFAIYLPVFNNALLDWDDHAYITNNPLVHSINLKEIFSQYVEGNYHPFTMLTLALEYQAFGLNPDGYHGVNLLLHLLNVVLVFYAVRLLSNKPEVALVVALLFGIHPLHVESVAWAAEVKDLLYTLFFLASYIVYIRYVKQQQKLFYAFALLLFVASLLSKAMAASLPVVLVLTDYFLGRKFNLKTILEKAPFFLLAIVFGVVAIIAQRSSDAIQDIETFGFVERIAFACYGFVTYLVRLVLPLGLSAYYPYPKSGIPIPVSYYAYIPAVVAIVVGVLYSLKNSKKIFFGAGFYAATVFLVLQLLPVGSTIMADRYSYIPSIGIFYLAAEGLYILWNKKLSWAAAGLVIVFTVFFSVKTYARCGVWQNEFTLWDDVISRYQTIAPVYNNRGVAFKEQNNTERALQDYSKAIELDPTYPEAYNNRAVIYTDEKKYDLAIEDLNKAIALKKNYAEAHNNRGIAFMYARKYEQALADYDRALSLDGNFAETYVNRANILRDAKRYDEALRDYAKAIELNPAFPKAYVSRGILFYNQQRYEEARKDINKGIALKPDFEEAYFDLGIISYSEKKYAEAIGHYSKAIELKPAYPEAFFNRGVAAYYAGNKEAACADLKQAGALGYPAADALRQLCP